MIKNEHQLGITKSRIEEFKRSLPLLNESGQEDIDPKIREAEKEGIRSQIEQLEMEVAEYEAHKHSHQVKGEWRPAVKS